MTCNICGNDCSWMDREDFVGNGGNCDGCLSGSFPMDPLFDDDNFRSCECEDYPCCGH